MSKYKAVRTFLDDRWFDSKKEAGRYAELKIAERAGLIKNLECQVPFELVVNGVKICKYIADFRYEGQDGRVCVEDSKGVKTPVYRLKSKLMLALHHIRIVET